MAVCKEAIGEFPPIPAPDDTWRLCHEDPPPIGKKVEVCWAKQKTPDSEVEYHISVGTMVERSTNINEHGHGWHNKNGLMLVFNPNFWREMKEDV